MPTAKIPTELSNDDRKALTAALTDALDEHETVKAEAAEKASEYREQLKGLDKRIHELKEQIKSGRGEIEVEVDERPGASGVIDLFRKGTDEKIGERPMRTEDRQMSLVSDAPATDEQREASTPAEAERMRIDRLRAEHADRIAQVMKEAGENVKLQELDGGGWLAMLELEPWPTDEGSTRQALREQGETEEAARKAVLDLYASTLPAFEEPQPTWDEVAAASAAQAEAEAVGGGTVEGAPLEPAPADDAPKALLKAPKGKKGKRIKVVDEAGTEITADETAPAAEEPAPPVPAGCFEDCSEDHEHVEPRLAF